MWSLDVTFVTFVEKVTGKRVNATTVSENEYGTFAILWSKSAIFRGAWQNVNMQPLP